MHTPGSTRTQRGRRAAPVLAALAAMLLALGGLVGGASAATSPSATVNGKALTGEGGKLTGCTFTVIISNLPDAPETPTPVGVTIAAVSPSAPEGAPITLVDDSATTSATTWTGTYPMDALVAPLEIKPNGYRLQVTVTADDTTLGSGTYWLACGAAQEGTPSRLVFAVNWQSLDQGLLTRLPEGVDATGFTLVGSTDMGPKGTATCTYLPGSDELSCTYANKGHGSKPGLVIPGNPKTTYTVAVAGVPTNWVVDPATIGTFLGRDTCPRGHEGGETTVAAETGGSTCTHTVVLIETRPGEPTPPAAVEAATATPVAAATPGFTG